MTSLDFLTPRPHHTKTPPEWGTGKMDYERGNLWTAERPTWQYSGEPTEQSYTLTDLKLSNLRTNDQLIPNPQHCDISKVQIKLPYPAEHPYASHIPRTALFPNFDSPDDPKTGDQARRHTPKNAHTPANAYDVIVLKKTKGSGLRHELQALPTESEKKPLHWHDHDFDQFMKYPDAEKQLYYPTPITLLNPNTSNRSDGKCLRGNMVVSSHIADNTKNLERDQWTTTYDRAHTGLGPANPYKLDNFHDKLGKDGDDDSLRPGTTRTFDPPRPVEGRIARQLTPPPAPQTDLFPEHPKDGSYRRKMTAHEVEEDRMWNGREYVNLPDATYAAVDGVQQNPEFCTTNLAVTQSQSQSPDALSTGHPGTSESSTMQQAIQDQHDRNQQIEASNRWKVLESQKPHHNLQARQHKMDLASVKQQPAVFYAHEGKFQRERAGLYNTTYDPSKLQGSMNRESESGARIMDISDSHVGALDVQTGLNQDMAEILRYNRTLGNPGSVAQLNDQPNQYETFQPFNTAKSMQKSALQPNVNNSDFRTQEGGLVLKESTYGDGYNTKKFLQENKLPSHARNEPLQLMSNANQNLNHVRLTCTPSSTAGRPLKVPDDILTGDPLPGGNWLSKSFDFGKVRPHSSPESISPLRYSYSAGSLQTKSATLPMGMPSLPVTLERSRIASRYGVDDQLVSRSTNFLPSTERSWIGKSAYQSQHPGGATPRKPALDLSFKNDERFNWRSDCGTPRPQTALRDIQDSFSVSEVRKRFHQQNPENGVDLRDNIVLGKKHNFNGINAQVFRGTPVVD